MVLRKDKDFSENTRELFRDCYECWKCGKNCWDCLHHVLGGNFEEADSPLNAAPLCNFSCHLGKSFSEEEKGRMLRKTKEYLELIGYRFTSQDNKFLEENKEFYENS